MAEAPADGPRVVLASASPRRLELLRRIGIEPEVRPADVDETVHPDEEPDAYVLRLAREKADAVAATLADDGALVVAADTTVVLGRAILGKPADDAAAAAMLRQLSDRTHQVLTGVAVRCGRRDAGRVTVTEVRFRALTDAEIDAYVAIGEPHDKAGGYGIQGAGGMFVTEIAGSDTNVVGLPLAALVALAAEVGVRLLPR